MQSKESINHFFGDSSQTLSNYQCIKIWRSQNTILEQFHPHNRIGNYKVDFVKRHVIVLDMLSPRTTKVIDQAQLIFNIVSSFAETYLLSKATDIISAICNIKFLKLQFLSGSKSIRSRRHLLGTISADS